jgi:hypothetical protein
LGEFVGLFDVVVPILGGAEHQGSLARRSARWIETRLGSVKAIETNVTSRPADPVRATLVATLLAALAIAQIAGCGSGVKTTTSPMETVDPPASLQRGWSTYVGRVGGFTVGVPPGWTIEQQGTSTVLRSPDKLAAISITADRTDAALSVPLESFATSAAKGLSGFEQLTVGAVTPYADHYDGVAVAANGRLKATGVLQRLKLVVLRRDNLAAFPVLATENARKRSPFESQVDAVVRSLRGRPVEVPAT